MSAPYVLSPARAARRPAPRAARATGDAGAALSPGRVVRGRRSLPELVAHAVDGLLNGTGMYRLVVVILLALLLAAIALAALRVLPVEPLAIAGSAVLLAAVCIPANALLARLFRAPSSVESPLVTALILSLIAGPVRVVEDPLGALELALAGLLAVASKYLLAPRRQHIFNPAALGVFLTGLLFNQYSSWWVGNAALLPVVTIGGLLILRKVGRVRVVLLFGAAFAFFLLGYSLLQGQSLSDSLSGLGLFVLQTEIVFLATVMLTEPVTSPKTFGKQAVHAVLVAFLLLPQLSVFGVSPSPEAALLIGNAFSYLVSPRSRLVLALKEKRQIGRGIWSFSFDYPAGFEHRLGQYMEWILPLASSDSRGNRRYLTIASSPTEAEMAFAVRVPERPSAYKRALLSLEPGDRVVAAELSGDFVLPPPPTLPVPRARGEAPLAFVAGGIGITPFRSMVRAMLDRGERRPMTLLYSSYGADEIVFRDVFDRAAEELGLKAVYLLTDPARVPQGWRGRVGLIDAAVIAAEVPEYARAVFYVSGPLAMVEGVRSSLRSLGVRGRRVRTDFFPGYTA